MILVATTTGKPADVAEVTRQLLVALEREVVEGNEERSVITLI
jgi:hypothetical protein